MATQATATGNGSAGGPPRRRGRRRTLKIAAGCLILGAAAWGVYALAGKAGGSTRSARAEGADLATVSLSSFDITTTATGELQAKNQIELRSELETETSIMELAPEGTVVKAGDLVVRLNGDQIQSSIDEVNLRVESGKADLIAAENAYKIQQSENDSKIREAKLKVDLAQLALDQWDKGERLQKEKDLDLDLDKTQKDLDRLKEKFALSEGLFKEGFLSKNDLQLDEIALREANAAREKAVLAYDTYTKYQKPKDERQKKSDLEEASAALDRVKAQADIQLAIKEADRVNKRRTLNLHEEKFAKLQKQLAACVMKAPQEGLVVYATSAGRNWFDDSPFTVGRKVRPQETLVVLPDTSEMVAAVRVHESLAGRVRTGQPSTIKIDAVGGKVFTGKVDSISVMADSQDRWRDPNRREYVIKVLVDKTATETPLKPSMRCEATINLGRVENVPTLPIQAVFSDEAVRFVYVPRGGKFARVPVKTGRRSDTFAEIAAGIEPGTRVLVREPAASEVMQEPWDEAKLKLVGLELDKNGKPSAIAPPALAKAPAAPAPKVAPKPGAKPAAGAAEVVQAEPPKTSAEPTQTTPATVTPGTPATPVAGKAEAKTSLGG